MLKLAASNAAHFPAFDHSGEDDDDDLDEMLKWSDSLDFESYHQGWLGLATSARPEWSGEAVAY